MVNTDVEKVGKLHFSKNSVDEMVAKEKGEMIKEEKPIKAATKEEKSEQIHDPESEKRIFWVVVTIIAIFVLFVAWKVFVPSPSPAGTEYVIYNDHLFTTDGMFLVTQWVKNDTIYDIPFRYNPYEVSDIFLEGTLDDRFNQGRIYITHDPAEHNLSYVAISAVAFAESLGRAFNILPVAACTEEKTEGCQGRPIIDCTAQNASVIYIKQDPETRVILSGNCMTVQGQGDELLRATDRVLLQWY